MRYTACLMALLLVMGAAAYDYSAYSDVEVRGSADWDATAQSATFVNQDPDPAEPGGYVELRFRVENLGKDAAKDVVFELLPEFPFSLDPGAAAVRRLGDIDARQTGSNAYVLYYKVRVSADAVQGDNELKLRYSTDGGQHWTLLDPFTVRVRSTDAILAVQDVLTTPEQVAAGQAALMSIKLKNLAAMRLKDIKVSMTLITTLSSATAVSQAELPIAPIGSTNEKVLVKLDPGELASVDFRIAVTPGSEAGLYKVPIAISYTDEYGTSYTKDAIVSVKVGEAPDILVFVEQSEVTQAGTHGTVSVRFVNRGSTNLKYLTMKLAAADGFEIIGPDELYLGNIDSDDYGTADFDVYVEKGAHAITLPIEAAFRDSHNSQFTRRFELPLRLYSDDEAKRLGLTEANGRSGMFIIVVIVIAGLAVYWWLRRRKKR